MNTIMAKTKLQDGLHLHEPCQFIATWSERDSSLKWRFRSLLSEVFINFTATNVVTSIGAGI